MSEWGSVPLRVSPGERDLLRRIIEAEDSEDGDDLVEATPGGWWLGSSQVSGKVCWRLLRHVLIRREDFASAGMQHWSVNETGRRVVADPAYVPPMIRMACGEQGPFDE